MSAPTSAAAIPKARRGPIFSPRSSAAPKVIRTGETSATAVASARSRNCQGVEETSRRHKLERRPQQLKARVVRFEQARQARSEKHQQNNDLTRISCQKNLTHVDPLAKHFGQRIHEGERKDRDNHEQDAACRVGESGKPDHAETLGPIAVPVYRASGARARRGVCNCAPVEAPLCFLARKQEQCARAFEISDRGNDGILRLLDLLCLDAAAFLHLLAQPLGHAA